MTDNLDYKKHFSGSYIDNRKHRLFEAEKDDVMQLSPTKYPWAIKDCFEMGCANNWMPTEIPMSQDYSDWDNLSAQEQWCLCFNFGFFATAEGLISDNLVRRLYELLPNPELRLYLLRQMYEEGLHSYTFSYIAESLPIDQQMIFNMHRNVDIINRKDSFSADIVSLENMKQSDLKTVEGKQKLLLNLVGFYIIMEGIFFYGGFPQILSFGRRNRMSGVCKQTEFILRDESVHIRFGTNLINTIKEEYPDVWTADFTADITNRIQDAVLLESECISYAMGGQDLIGLAADDIKTNVEYVADRRLSSIGLSRLYNSPSTLPWLLELTDLTKDTNFFEGTVQNYRMDGLEFLT